MNYVDEYTEITHSISGKSGIYARLENTKKGRINILVAEDEQIARRIMFIVQNGLEESLEDDLPNHEDLFLETISEYTIINSPAYGGMVYLHKRFR